MSKTHWKKLFNPTWLGSWDFDPGQDKILTISKVTQEEVVNGDGKKDTVPVVHFAEDEKPFIVNVTNSKAIDQAAGSHYIEDWIGKKIALYVTQVKAFGTVTDAVRVRPVAPKKPALDSARFDKMLQSIVSGNFTKEQAQERFSLTKAQAEKIAAL